MTEQALTPQAHAQSLTEYIATGTERALALGNRGPVRFDVEGRLTREILDAYHDTGFYVFSGVVGADEIATLRRDFDEILERAPVDNTSGLDARGRPALGMDLARRPYSLIDPLTDPWGGTRLLGGRHPVKMREPRHPDHAPPKTVFLVTSMCQLSEAALHLYGHPDILAMAASINGEDFTPYNDAVFIKEPGLGGAVSWHQDGVTHWDSSDWHEDIHGFNVQVQLYRCTPANGLWVVPGTHRAGRIDIPARIAANAGSELLPDAVPLLCEPGDVTIVNRQALHCSFPNTSAHRRISITYGFHRRTSVLGARGALSQDASEVYDESRIRERSAVIQLAIDARAGARPGERRFRYAPFVGAEDSCRDSPEVRERVLKDYALRDLSI